MTPEEVRDRLRARPDYLTKWARYAEVPDLRATMKRFWTRQNARDLAALRSPAARVPDIKVNAEMVSAYLTRLSTHADDYFWSPDLAASVFESSASIPLDWRFEASLLPSRHGFMYFGGYSFAIPTLEDTPVIGMGWIPVTLHEREDMSGVLVLPLIKDPRLPALASVHLDLVLFDRTIEQGQMELQLAELHRSPVRLRFFAAALTWMSQRIVVAHEAALDRVTARRLSKAGEEPRAPRVVMLRREERQAVDNAGHKHVEWTCQWIVRGHWRRQFFASSGQHRPKYILPYVKGPDGKPLKAEGGARLFAVER